MNFPQSPFNLKNLFFLICLGIFLFPLHAQVGIGTAIPDPSSVLDISSTSHGILAPRMTTVQRNAIADPAESLLVYDTTEKAYFYYDEPTTTWLQLISSKNIRDNYKLIKSVDDLAIELINGGGSKYLLDMDAYYEINGTIFLAAPIELNNATIVGRDANDVLYSAGTVFTGNTGGTVLDVTITGGGTAFNVTGGVTLVIQNTTIAGMSSVGNVSGVGVFFSNNMYYVANTTGITYTNIPTLLLNNQAWMGDNGGTFESFIGNFDLIQKVSGFSTVNGTAKGFDVSSNPTVGTGVLLNTVFTGTGTYINGYMPEPYEGHDFTNQWTVDCPGILEESDRVASAHMYFALENDQVTNITSDNTPVKMAGTTTASNLYRMNTDGGINNRIKYKGERLRHFTVTSSATIERTDNGSRNVYSLIIYKNGSIIPSIVSEQTFENGISKGNFTVVGSLTLDTDDYIEVFVSTDNRNIDPTITRFNLVIE